MTDLDFSRCRLEPFQHQREDVAWLLERPYAFIASEMRTGKSKIVVDAAQFLFEAGVIDKVVVVAPAPVRDVWYDPQLGELAKHLWATTPAAVTEFHARTRKWTHNVEGVERGGRRLEAYVTNFEFLRSKDRLGALLPACGPKTMLVLDESSFVKNHAAQQTKACLQLRRACGRVVLLNGTPLFHSPLDLFSQGNLLHESIVGTKFVTQFKARYAVMQPVLRTGGRPMTNAWGKPIMKVESWTNLDDLQRRFAPVTVRRLQKDCLDLPPKLDPVTLTATLTPETWRAYKAMRDELVIWLSSNDVVTAATAAVRVMRLSQITSGFLGGVEDAVSAADAPQELIDDASGNGLDAAAAGTLDSTDGTLDQAGSRDAGVSESDRNRTSSVDERSHHRRQVVEINDAKIDDAKIDDSLEGLDYGEYTPENVAAAIDSSPRRLRIQDVGREKLDVLLWFIEQRLAEDPNLHLVAWSRFRAEVERTLKVVGEHFKTLNGDPLFETAAIWGGQKKADRLRALALLKPETSPAGPVFVCGIEGTGSFGLDMTAAHTCVTLSSGYSPGRAAQTLDRVYGPGQTQPIAYYDVIAVGPNQQKTIDKDILVARRAGQDVAEWTAAHWVKALKEE